MFRLTIILCESVAKHYLIIVLLGQIPGLLLPSVQTYPILR